MSATDFQDPVKPPKLPPAPTAPPPAYGHPPPAAWQGGAPPPGGAPPGYYPSYPPTPGGAPPPPAHEWNGDICKWCGACTAADWGICCLSTWCLPCVFGWTHMRGLGMATGDAVLLGTIFLLVSWLLNSITLGLAGAAIGFWYRSQLRARHGLPGDDCSDFALWWCCAPCAACQEARTVLHAPVTGGVWGATAPPLGGQVAAELGMAPPPVQTMTAQPPPPPPPPPPPSAPVPGGDTKV